jgi:hypothetical protein
LPVYDKPRIYITSLKGRKNPATETIGFSLSFDYRLDDIGVYYRHKDERALEYYFSIARGLQQSTVEGVMLDGLQPSNAYSTTDILLKANEQGLNEYVITPNTLSKIDSIGSLPAAAKEYLKETVVQGYHIIIPEKAVVVDSQAYWAWWKLDPVTGKTQGVLENKLHGAFVEYNIVQREVVVNDTRGFVLGMLAGANSTQMLIMSNILAGNTLDESTVANIETKLQQLACTSCMNPELSVEVALSLSGKISCFELYEIIAHKKKIGLSGPLSFCESYSAGFNCAIKMVLGKLSSESNMDVNDPLSVKTNLSCPSQ